MNDKPDNHWTAEEPAPEKRKRGRPAGKKVAASRITGGPGKSARSVEVLVRFPEADFRRIAAEARSKTTTDPDVVRQLVRRGWDFENVLGAFRELCRRLDKLEFELEETRWRSMAGRLRWFEESVDEIRSGTGPMADAIAQAVVRAVLEHNAKVDAENP